MVDGDSQVPETLSLDPDESQHLALVPESVQVRLSLANDAAKIALDIASEAMTRSPHGSPPFFVLTSLTKGANFARLAFVALELGYYAGAASLIRVLYESLLYAILFNSHPEKVGPWLRIALDDQTSMDGCVTEQQLRNMAKEAFNKWSGEKELGKEIWEMASNLIHHTAESLALELGLEPQQLLPEELATALESSEGDFDLAMKLMILGNKFGRAPIRVESAEESQSAASSVGAHLALLDEETLHSWSMILLYLVHRMTDFAYERFPPHDREIKRGYKRWHKAVKSM